VFAGRGVFDAESVLQIAARKVVVQLTLGAAVFETRADGFMAPAIRFNVTAFIEGSALGMNIENTRSAKTILRRKRSSNQVNVIGKSGIELIRKSVDAFRDENIVDAVLHITVLVPDMKTARSFGILADTRKTENQLVKRDVITLGEILNFLLIDGVYRRSETGHDFLASLIQLTHDRDFLHLHR